MARHNGLIGLLALSLVVALAYTAAADVEQVSLDQGIADIVKQVVKIAEIQDQKTIRVSGFNNPFDSEKTAGAGIRGRLINKLKEQGIKHQERALLALTGEFQVAAAEIEGDGGNDKVPAAKIGYKLTNRAGTVLLDSEKSVKGESSAYVTDKADVAMLAGLIVEVDPKDTKKANEEINKALESDAKTTTVVIDGTMIRPQKDSKFAVEIFKAKLVDQKASLEKYQAVQPGLRDGVPYVDISAGEVYAVNICNENDFEVAAKLTVDGLSMFQFSSERARCTDFWIFEPNQSYPLVGWHRSGDDFDSFLVSEYSKAEVGKSISDDSKFGQITVEFHRAFKSMDEMPEGERGNRTALQTTHGPPLTFAKKAIKRFTGKFRAAVTVHYDRSFPDLPKEGKGATRRVVKLGDGVR